MAASKKDGVVEHPLLDKVRACSSNPDDAADFFLQLLHPYPLCRMSVEAQAHPYLAETSSKMQAYCKSAPLMTLPYALSLLAEGLKSGRTIAQCCL